VREIIKFEDMDDTFLDYVRQSNAVLGEQQVTGLEELVMKQFVTTASDSGSYLLRCLAWIQASTEATYNKSAATQDWEEARVAPG
jgi:hypothetical protein